MLLIKLLKHLSNLFVGVGVLMLADASWYIFFEDDGVSFLFGTQMGTTLTAIVVGGPFLLAWAFRWVIAPAKDTTQSVEPPKSKEDQERGGGHLGLR